MNQFYSWQVRSPDCFAKIIDKSLLKEGTTGIPQEIMVDFFGRLLQKNEEVAIQLRTGDTHLSCKIRCSQGRHRLFMSPFKQYLRDKNADIDDLIIFDRAFSNKHQFYISIISIENNLLVSPIESERLVGESIATTSTRRIGQETFRELLLRKYNARCCLSGVYDLKRSSQSILKASHIKPWAESDQYEKLNVNNGLLLTPQYDALFDKNLISFDKGGKILISPNITGEIFNSWSLGNLKLNSLNDEMEFFMGYHRERLKS